jgi:hypothetical protein
MRRPVLLSQTYTDYPQNTLSRNFQTTTCTTHEEHIAADLRKEPWKRQEEYHLLKKNRSRLKRNFQTFGETLFGNFGISVIAKLHDEKDGINKQRLYAFTGMSLLPNIKITPSACLIQYNN